MGAPVHDAALFDLFAAEAEGLEDGLRRGKMFGAPALYRGRRMVGCVLGDEIGLRVDADTAAQAIARGRATRFTPYGKPPMKEWIALPPPDDMAEIADLIRAALARAARDG